MFLFVTWWPTVLLRTYKWMIMERNWLSPLDEGFWTTTSSERYTGGNGYTRQNNEVDDDGIPKMSSNNNNNNNNHNNDRDNNRYTAIRHGHPSLFRALEHSMHYTYRALVQYILQLPYCPVLSLKCSIISQVNVAENGLQNYSCHLRIYLLNYTHMSVRSFLLSTLSISLFKYTPPTSHKQQIH